jgi:hypothetical protein
MLKIVSSVVFTLLFNSSYFSQVIDIVSIKTLGQGKTIEDATTSALREALSQAYGVFISSNTTIVNDSLFKDEIVSLTTGNIEKYNILSQTEIPGIGYSVFVNANVSLNKLSSFAQSKGSEATFDGGGFAIKIKLQKLNEQAEVKALSNLLLQTWKYIDNSILFDLNIEEPKLANQNPETYSLKVNVKTRVIDSTKLSIEQFLINGLNQICVTDNEFSDLQKLEKQVYKLNQAEYLGNQTWRQIKTFKFRNENSLRLMYVFSFKLNNLFFGFNLLDNIFSDDNKVIPVDINSKEFITIEHPTQYLFRMSHAYENLFLYHIKNPYQVNLEYLKEVLNSDFQGNGDLKDFEIFLDWLKRNRYLFDDDLWDEHLENLFEYTNPNLYTLGEFLGPNFEYQFNYSLSELEKLKGFAVEKNKIDEIIEETFKDLNAPKSKIIDTQKQVLYSETDIPPSFIGGDTLLERYLFYSIESPEWASGTISPNALEVSFIVEIDGRISNISLIKSNESKEIGDAVIKAIEMMPNWNPGEMNGQKVRSLVILPINLGQH